MKKYLMRGAALALSILIILGLSACYSEDNAWAAKRGDKTITIGSYIYFLNNAYTEAREKVSSDEEVLKAEIDGTPAEEWIESRALEYIDTYFYLLDKLEAEGIPYTEEDEAAVSETGDTAWSYYKDSLEEVGVSEESFMDAYARYSVLYEKLFKHYYGEGGELEPSEEELKAHFVDNYYRYEYFYSSLTGQSEDGGTTELPEDEQELRIDNLKRYADEISAGNLTTEEAASRYDNNFEPSMISTDESGEETINNYMSESILPKENLSETFQNALDGAADGEATYVESINGLHYVITRLSLEDAFEDYIENEEQQEGLLYSMKAEEFENTVRDGAGKISDITINEHAINRVKLSKFIDDSNKSGAMLSSEESESSSSSLASSESSSETSSQE